jgi:polysaccharide export outer membrane protein
VQAAGETVPQLRAEIASALADGYIKDPRVSAEVITFRPYYILGEVEKPGNYPYVNGITVMNAIATAGGFTYRANTHDVFIKKPNETVEHKVRLNDTLKLAPGDTIRISERYF